MRIQKRDGGKQRQILIGMIVSKSVLSRIAAKWEDKLFGSKWSNLVGGWCVKFYKKYDKAPGKQIQGMFESWASETGDVDTVALVEKFLESLSGEYSQLRKEINADYLVDQASLYFNKVKLTKLKSELEGDLDTDEIEKGLNRVQVYSKIDIGIGAGIDLFQDQNAIRDAFSESSRPIIRLPGDMGKFFGDALMRDSFVSLLGREKMGKSWWLIHFAWMALKSRCKVAFFEIGDLSQRQIIRRFMARAARHSLKARSVKYPIGIMKEIDDRICTIDHEIKKFEDPLSWKDGWYAVQDFMENTVKSRKSMFKLSCHPNYSLSVYGIQSILNTWENDGWVPDVIVIDYADLLVPVDSKKDNIHQISETWARLRALSQTTHSLVLTATQANKQSYFAYTLGPEHFSDSKTKLAHVSGMVGLNSTPAEKEIGAYRLNWVNLREDDFSTSRCLHTAACLSLGNPAVLSTF